MYKVQVQYQITRYAKIWPVTAEKWIKWKGYRNDRDKLPDTHLKIAVMYMPQTQEYKPHYEYDEEWTRR